MTAYAELHCLTHYSFLQAASSPAEMVQRAAELGYQAISITDECSFAGVVKAWQAAKAHNIQLLVGCFFNDPTGRYVCLVKNLAGYQQLSALISHCRQQAEKGSYLFKPEWLLSKPLPDCELLWLPAANTQAVSVQIADIRRLYANRFAILAVRDRLASDQVCARAVSSLAAQLDAPIAASNAALLHSPERLPLLHTINAIAANTTVAAMESEHWVNAERHLRPCDQLTQLFPLKWLQQSALIARQCSFDLGCLRYQYPGEVVPAGYTPANYLAEQAQAGAQRRYPAGVPQKVQSQLDAELALVEQLNYEHFFLTIYDLVQFAESQHILFQGRGSAANSVLCYCLGITAVDPDQSELLFERFISKERDEPPDIDVDFEHQRREEVIQYIYRKYGRHRAALTATVITYRLRSAIKDVGKALGFPLAQLSQLLTRLDRRDSEDDWQKQLDALGVLQHPMGGHLLQLVEQIRGFPRHLSQHVGGFVIAAERLSDLVPVENAAMPERTVIQWDKNDIEALKLLKVDVLGLGMLSALRRGFQWVEHCYGRTLTIGSIPQEDQSVYAMLQRADAVGIFQVESRAQMNMLPRLKPKTFYDLVVQIAIVRPGPIQGDMVHPYLRRRDGLEPEDYPNPAVEAVLKRTLGVPIFQEQVIKLAMVAAGFSGGEADQLRRAMGTWKSTGQMLEFKRKIVSGMLARGYDESFALRLFEQICGFGEYGFPESHSASFANLAYASAWLKYYYPAAFYVGLLNSLPMGFYSAAQLIQDARQHQVTVLPVCINNSLWEHQLTKEDDSWALRLGFCVVKGLSKDASDQITVARPGVGFAKLTEIESLAIPSSDLQALASADAFRGIAGHRYQARWDMTHLGEQLPLLTEAEAGQAEYQLTEPSAVDTMVQDYAATGLTLGTHPLALLNQQGVLPTHKRAQELIHLRSGQVVTVIGLVVGRQRPSTSTGVTFITLEDETGNVNVVLWQKLGRQQRQHWLHAKLLQVTGTVEIEESVVHVVAGRLRDISDRLPTQAIRSRDFH
ncbi:error-prone DNA polymerase [Aliidiomarina soli]|uniref:Error-prone DNA polymerase n=1 Tax=Aliidiomarina soli TaxID=1928574 RepID=A0A432WIQ3_9GAMM|nr:error-prone DNA polymerase [Aliidiomarina soli]RUO33591.1 error-prone DNA polymerase [Aliidiomarina soli]